MTVESNIPVMTATFSIRLTHPIDLT